MSSLYQQTKLMEIAKWNRLAETWPLSAPPAVPSIEEVQIYRECLLKYKTGDSFCVVILGSTKELRKIFLDNPELADTKVCCVDWCERMYTSNGELGNINNPNERFLCEDWQRFDLAGEYADVILGDKSIDNVPFPLWEELFEHLCTILRPGGGLILHLGLNTQQFVGVSFENALIKWANELGAGRINLETAASGLWEDCLTGSAFIAGTDPHVCSVSKYNSELNEFRARLSSINDTTVVSLFHEFVHLFGPSNSDEWTAYTMDDVRESSSTFFDVKDVYFSRDYEAAPSSPIIELTKPSVTT